jgi:hypothetical protein
MTSYDLILSIGRKTAEKFLFTVILITFGYVPGNSRFIHH